MNHFSHCIALPLLLAAVVSVSCGSKSGDPTDGTTVSTVPPAADTAMSATATRPDIIGKGSVDTAAAPTNNPEQEITDRLNEIYSPKSASRFSEKYYSKGLKWLFKCLRRNTEANDTWEDCGISNPWLMLGYDDSNPVMKSFSVKMTDADKAVATVNIFDNTNSPGYQNYKITITMVKEDNEWAASDFSDKNCPSLRKLIKDITANPHMFDDMLEAD